MAVAGNKVPWTRVGAGSGAARRFQNLYIVGNRRCQRLDRRWVDTLLPKHFWWGSRRSTVESQCCLEMSGRGHAPFTRDASETWLCVVWAVLLVIVFVGHFFAKLARSIGKTTLTTSTGATADCSFSQTSFAASEPFESSDEEHPLPQDHSTPLCPQTMEEDDDAWEFPSPGGTRTRKIKAKRAQK